VRSKRQLNDRRLSFLIAKRLSEQTRPRLSDSPRPPLLIEVFKGADCTPSVRFGARDITSLLASFGRRGKSSINPLSTFPVQTRRRKSISVRMLGVASEFGKYEGLSQDTNVARLDARRSAGSRHVSRAIPSEQDTGIAHWKTPYERKTFPS
jgi:hypothetical protein